MIPWTWVTGWVGLLGFIYAGSGYLESRAAMRGTHREPLSPTVDRVIRLFFLGVFAMPLFLVLPWWVAGGLVALYAPTYVDGSEKTGNRTTDIVRDAWFFHKLKKYFDLEIVAAGGKLDPSKKYVIGLHPHGFLPFGTMVNVLSRVNDVHGKFLNGVKLRALAASFCFYVPGYRDLCLGGGVIDAARYNARRALDEGCSLCLVPGGATEGLYAFPGKHILVINKRLGFVKLALETGAWLVPSYSFGENNCYEQLSTKLPAVKKFQAKFQRVLGLSLPLVTNLIPKKSKIATVFGAPIPCTRIEEPTEAQVKEKLEEYKAALKNLFDDHAATYIPNPDERTLEFI